MKKITKAQVLKLKIKSRKNAYGLQTAMIASLKVGEGITIKLDDKRPSMRFKWHEYATRAGIKIKTFKTDNGLLVIERVN